MDLPLLHISPAFSWATSNNLMAAGQCPRKIFWAGVFLRIIFSKVLNQFAQRATNSQKKPGKKPQCEHTVHQEQHFG